jgi:hypothetical protein
MMFVLLPQTGPDSWELGCTFVVCGANWTTGAPGTGRWRRRYVAFICVEDVVTLNRDSVTEWLDEERHVNRERERDEEAEGRPLRTCRLSSFLS